MEKGVINNHDELTLKETFIERILTFLEIYGQLKTIYRSNVVPGGRKESVAEHCWRVALLVILVAPSLDRAINIEKAMKMAIIHDLAESITGDTDILTLLKNEGLNATKTQEESLLFHKMKELIGGTLGSELLELWIEFEENFTYEAKLVNALDKLEAQLQQNETGSTKWKELAQLGKLAHLESLFIFDSFLNDLKNSINLKRTY